MWITRNLIIWVVIIYDLDLIIIKKRWLHFQDKSMSTLKFLQLIILWTSWSYLAWKYDFRITLPYCSHSAIIKCCSCLKSRIRKKGGCYLTWSKLPAHKFSIKDWQTFITFAVWSATVGSDGLQAKQKYASSQG